MALTKIILGRQSKVTEDVLFSMKHIKELADPVDDQDAVTKAWALSQVSNGSGVIGTSEDGNYTDGLFVDFTATTPVGTAVDRFNEVLKSLSPQPAPAFSSASCTTAGVSGKLSFGASNAISGYTNVPGVDINGAFTASGTRIGIINGGTSVTGVLANNVTPSYANSRPYPNLSFGDGDAGTLHLEVNGTVVHSVDLSTFGSGASYTSSSGFTLSAATAVAFTNGDLFNVFKYRTGTWLVSTSHTRLGYNYVRIRHEYASGLYRTSQTYDWVVDGEGTATTITSESLSSLTMSGSRKISGVEFYTAGTVAYNGTVTNAYRNTYSASASALNFTGTNVSISDEALTTAVSEASLINIVDKSATINAARLLNGSLTVNLQVDRTVQSDITSVGASISGILLDTTADNSTNSLITFNGETKRYNSSLTAWDSSQSLLTNDGLQVYNGQLIYPKTNFSLITNGPISNVNYTTATGLRTFIGYFYDASARSNFRFNIAGSSIAFVTVATGPSGNNLTFEINAPNTTNGWKDAMVAHSGVDTDLGCYASTYGNVVPTSWGCTLGTKNTSTAGNMIVVKITASAAWTGNLSSIGITWL